MFDSEFLTSEEQDKLKQFLEITNTGNKHRAYQLLLEHNWNVPEAILTFFAVGENGDDFGEHQADLPVSENNRNVEPPEDDLVSRNNEIHEIPTEDIGEANEVRLAVVPLVAFMDQPAETIIEHFLYNFIARFRNTSNRNIAMPPFYTSTLENAMKLCFNHENQDLDRPLILYIHNEHGRQTENFVKNVLCNKLLGDLIEEKFIVYPWDTTDILSMEQMKQMLIDSQMRGVHDYLRDFARNEQDSFPLMMVIHRKRYSYEIIGRFDGRSTLNDVIGGLHDTYDLFKKEQLVEISKNMEQKKEREIFDQQKAEYDASLQADLEKKKAKTEQDKPKELDSQKDGNKITEQEENDKHRIEELLAQLPKEPEISDPDCITIRFRFPDRTQGTRRFLKTDLIQTMVNFLSTKRYFPDSHHYLNSESPRKDIVKTFDCTKSFKDANWPKNENVLVVMD